MSIRVLAWTTLAMVAFASNSVLCRIALREATIDPASFSTIRLASGAITLLFMTAGRRRSLRWSLASSGLLALYAIPFSFAYTGLSTGTGALILFGAVQLTMLGATLRSGETVHVVQWAGLSLALAGLVYLVAPTLATPSLIPALLMAVAGASWGLYSLRGRGASHPLAVTTTNFAGAVPFALAVSLVSLPRLHIEARGALLAVASGAIASGMGYVLWFAALRGLSGLHAAIVQLSVPVLAAGGGVMILAEAVSIRLIASTGLVLCGIALAIAGGELSKTTCDSDAAHVRLHDEAP